MDTQAKNTTSTASTTTEGAAAKPAQAAVTLESPIQRGATHIELLHLRRPLAGALRGINLAELLNLRAEAVMVLLPRITEPPLTKPEVEKMDPVDLVACALEVVNFLAPAERVEAVKLAQKQNMESLGM